MRTTTGCRPALVLIGLLALAWAEPASAPSVRAADAAPEDLNDLSLQVDALLTLHYFDVTLSQLEALAKLTRTTAPKPAARTAGKASDKFRAALAELRDALVKGKNGDQVGGLRDTLDELRAQEDPDLDDDVEITDAARRQIDAALRLLSVRQVAGYLEHQPYELPDPLEQMLDALDKAGDLKDAEWQELREDVVDEVSWLLGGLDKKKAKPIATRVEQWLTQVRSLSAKDRERKRPELEKAARQFVEQVPPTTVMHHIVEHALAELLSNPQLTAAINARLGK